MVPDMFPLNFSPYITFLGHIINSLSPTFSSPAVIPPKYSPYTPLQYKISFSIPTFHILSIFLLLRNSGRGSARAAAGGERGVPRRGVRGRGPCCGLSRAPVAPIQGEGARERQPLRAVLDMTELGIDPRLREPRRRGDSMDLVLIL
jgi:hypothetical protein